MQMSHFKVIKLSDVLYCEWGVIFKLYSFLISCSLEILIFKVLGFIKNTNER
jgi:hypothetical protein